MQTLTWLKILFMKPHRKIPEKLSFLKTLKKPSSEGYRKAPWLLNDFSQNIWHVNFEYKEAKHLNWCVELYDGSVLTEPKNERLLTSFKHFVIIATSNHGYYDAHTNGLKTQVRSYSIALKIIDHLLLNAEAYGLLVTGLAGLSDQNLMGMLNQFAQSSSSVESVYEWPERLASFLLKLRSDTSDSAINQLLASYPHLSVVTEQQIELSPLPIPMDEVPAIRASLILNGYASRWPPEAKASIVNIPKISHHILSSTVKAKDVRKPIYPILDIDNDDFYRTEYEAMPVSTTEGSKMTDSIFLSYRKALYSMGTLHKLGADVPSPKSLQAIQKFVAHDSKAGGSFRTAPSEVVLSSVKNAIEFHYKYGSDIVLLMSRLLKKCQSENVTLNKITDKDVMSLCPESLMALGVKKLGITALNVGSPYGPASADRKGSRTNYYKKLRANVGFLELFGVYVGCVQIVTGAMTARRLGELTDLPAKGSLDKSRQWLKFWLRKSSRGMMGRRKSIMRPIEPVAAEMIGSLEAYHQTLLETGFTDEDLPLFASPTLNAKGTISSGVSVYLRNLDLFCDYFETALCDGKRYYLRQHQLRRFFAMLFFHCAQDGDESTIRWMLGHVDLEHLWHYINENIDGTILAGAKAHHLAQQIYTKGEEGYTDLMDLINETYGTQTYVKGDAAKLEERIEQLVNNGLVDAEPEFILQPGGTKLRIVTTVRRNIHEQD
ncbi:MULTISPECIES: site-specific recombinase [unclassified Pseudomonas]|uniref:site-specific recombinase n=1 Tax=unclassified Pseudomonas TaxID=196821 RepID=UPI00210C94D5|nr:MULTISPECIES: site-specific recombinase [unclassified Pseudomonas]